MNTKLFLFSFLTFLFISTFSQNEQCGTMQNLQKMLEKNPSLKIRFDEIEKQTQELIKKGGMELSNYQPWMRPPIQQQSKIQDILSLCGYNNTSYTVIAAPTTLNQKVSPNPNCTYGGEYVRVTGLMAGRTYRISTCATNTFDTQLTIYPQGGGLASAHNDEWCGSQSEIYFTPINSGSYDVLVDAYNCASNSVCASVVVELWNIPRPKIVIPVVVHVIHFGENIGSGRNISDAQINSQISVLNTDFRRLNPDITAVPAVFRGASADPLIEFCLAQQDEAGNPTTGINRYTATTAKVTRDDMENSIKLTTIWDRNKYLNLWTVDFGAPDQDLLGYAQFPGASANTDGVVIKYTSFGNVGNVTAPFNLGRTTTHEVGHWLNLRHIWGDDTDCSGTDFVSDTPDQEIESSGMPTFPLFDACATIYPGCMFYNYMDYSDDKVTSMFTYGQWARMDASLFGPRLSLQSSQGCVSTVGIDKYSSDDLFSIYPNPNNGKFTLKTALNKVQDLKVNIFSVLGDKIYEYHQEKQSTEHLVISIDDRSPGVYFVHLTYNGQTAIKKVVFSKQN